MSHSSRYFDPSNRPTKNEQMSRWDRRAQRAKILPLRQSRPPAEPNASQVTFNLRPSCMLDTATVYKSGQFGRVVKARDCYIPYLSSRSFVSAGSNPAAVVLSFFDFILFQFDFYPAPLSSVVIRDVIHFYRVVLSSSNPVCLGCIPLVSVANDWWGIDLL